MTKIISWSIARRDEPWRALVESDTDIALLSEAAALPPDVAKKDRGPSITVDHGGSGVNRPWKATVVRLSDRVRVYWIDCASIQDANPGELAVTRPGTVCGRRFASHWRAVHCYCAVLRLGEAVGESREQLDLR